jgi:[acyl-carrier-protein] S-malonyltransferase
MQAAVPVGAGAMMAVMKVNRETVDAICAEVSREDHVVSVANYNAPEQIVISGHTAAVLEAGDKLTNLEATTKLLNVSAPFHSPLMQPAAEQMRRELEQVTFLPLKWPVIANVSARPYNDPSEIAEMLAEQVAHPVRWQETMEYLNGVGIQKVVEMGPGNVLKNLLKRSFSGILVANLDHAAQLDDLRVGLGLHRDLKRVISRTLAHAVSTRNRNFDQQAYQKGVVEPYQQIQLLQNRLEGENVEPTVEQALEALEHLKTIFTTKQVPMEEQSERFAELFEETQTQKDFAKFDLPALSLV